MAATMNLLGYDNESLGGGGGWRYAGGEDSRQTDIKFHENYVAWKIEIGHK